MRSLKLSTGQVMPAVGLGSWNLTAEQARETIPRAVQLGYRLFDCAAVYKNEAGLGAEFGHILRDIQRADMFVVSKLWCTMHATDRVPAACKQSVQVDGPCVQL